MGMGGLFGNWFGPRMGMGHCRMNEENNLNPERRQCQRNNAGRRHCHGRMRNLGKLQMAFISDVNLLDGEVVPPLQKLQKIWKVANNGTEAWPQDTTLIVDGEDGLNCCDFVVPPAKPGEQVEVSVMLLSPATLGKCKTTFSLSSSGKRFGAKLWFDLIVSNEKPQSKPEVNKAQIQEPEIKGQPEEKVNKPHSVDQPFSPQLNFLEGMGFNIDNDVLRHLLGEFKGDLSNVLSELLNQKFER